MLAANHSGPNCCDGVLKTLFHVDLTAVNAEQFLREAV